MTPGGDDLQFDWRRGGAAAGALFATLILLAMVVLVAMSNQARDRALEGERHAYDVNLLTRARRCQHLPGRSGARPLRPRRGGQDQRQHLLQPVAACRAADPPARAAGPHPIRNNASGCVELKQLYQISAARNSRLPRAPRSPKQGSGGTGYFYQAAQSDDRRQDLSREARRDRRRRSAPCSASGCEQTQFFSAEADRLTDYLSWLGVIVGLGAIFLGVVAVQAIRQFAYAKKLAEIGDRARRSARGSGCANAPRSCRRPTPR